MKLLQILPTNGRGGCEGYALTVAREAIRRNWSVHVAVPEGQGTASLVKDYCAAGACPHAARLDVPAGSRPHARGVVAMRTLRVLRLLAAIRPQLAQVVLPGPHVGLGPVLACGLLRVPTLVVFQLVIDGDPVLGRTERAYAWARSRRQRWVAVSRNNRDLIARGFAVPPAEIQVVYNGASLPTYVANELGRSEMRRSVRNELGLASETPLILAVGRLERQKGFDLLLAAAARVCREAPTALVAIAGEGTDRRTLEAQAKELGLAGHLRLLGHRTDIPHLLAASDVFAFPTRVEGHPFALVEAMAAGLPVVAANVSGITEIIEHDRNGILTPAEDVPAVAAGILRLLREPALRRAMGTAAAATARAFSEEQMLDETFAAFAGLAVAGRSQM